MQSRRKSSFVSFSWHGERHIWWFRKSILRDTWIGVRMEFPPSPRGARTWIVRQYLHLLPRSVIYFEDFLSSCTPRAARRFLYALCVGRDWNIFLLTRQREARRDIFPYAAFRFFSKMKKTRQQLRRIHLWIFKTESNSSLNSARKL